jgi:hypothetical protein
MSMHVFKQVGLPQHLVCHKMSFWVHHGLILELKQGSSTVKGVNGVNALRRRQRHMDHSSSSAPSSSSLEPCTVYCRARSLDPALHGKIFMISPGYFGVQSDDHISQPCQLYLSYWKGLSSYLMKAMKQHCRIIQLPSI